MKKCKVAIVGAVGYTGFMLMKLLARHGGAEVVCATSRAEAGKAVNDVYPALSGAYDGLCFTEPNTAELKKVDLAFTALPAGVSAAIGGELFDAGVKVVDLSADYRYDSLELYESTYKVKHPRGELLKSAVYGLCEYNRAEIAKAGLVGNPGCYVTSAVLALKPLLEAGLIERDGIIVDGKSGVTGAGRKAEVGYSFCECDDNFKVYKPVGHRHTTEMEEKTGASLTFTPHLLPIKRGILSTVYARTKTADYGKIAAAYKRYECEPFVAFTGEDLPEINAVRGSNRCLIGAVLDPAHGLIKIVSVLDNLIKGASGQAVQNMNIMLGFNECEALPRVGEHL